MSIVVSRWFVLPVLGLAAATVVASTPSVAFADETREAQWMVDALGLEEAWKTTKGAGVTVGIVDTGVDATHPDLDGNVLAGTSVMPDSDPADDGLTDEEGHGTAMAGLIAGHGHGTDGADGVIGVAPEAKVLSVHGITGVDDGDDYGTDTASAIRWLADNGADIISLSYAGGTMTDGPEEDAIQYATVERGIPVVAGAGNVGDLEAFGLNNGDPVDQDQVENPAAYEQTIAVSATNQSGKFAESISHYGPEVAISAPGEDVEVAKPNSGYDNVDGTSVSTAIVAGTLALLKAAYPDATRMELTWRIAELSKDAGDEGPDDKFGYGIVDPVAALTEDPGPLPEEMADPTPTGTYPETDSPDSADALAGTDTNGSDLLWPAVGLVAGLAIVTAAVLLLRRNRSRSGE